MTEFEQYAEAVRKHGSNRAAARALGVDEARIRRRLKGVGPAGGDRGVDVSVANLQAELRTMRAALTQKAQAELDEEFVKAKIVKLAAMPATPPAWLVPKQFAKGSPGVPTLFASDWHWAEVVDARQIGGVNEYNLEIAHARARRMVLTTIDLLTNHMASPKYPGIVFALGGDMVSGDIHEELMATNEAEIMPTLVDLFGVLIWCTATLADRFGRVFLPCVSGNHGR